MKKQIQWEKLKPADLAQRKSAYGYDLLAEWSGVKEPDGDLDYTIIIWRNRPRDYVLYFCDWNLPMGSDTIELGTFKNLRAAKKKTKIHFEAFVAAGEAK